ncbi:WxL domain-containing protein [Bacillus sp. DNRA2]|uniref:WxL domain-containing protein n=1 Tax=Bacillus sp. DNRA2 TaxID=2723053 RepID=UPI00145E741F|nr:WxL domain-containing protein [Bacillus sp. DNRA2]
MRISKIVLIVLVSILSLTLLAQGILAATSTATVTFTEDTSTPPVLDPDDGSLPDPAIPGTGQAGPLSLDYVTGLNFGSQIVSLETMTYEANELKPFIQVTDKRGNPTGWKVTVSASAFTSASTDTLEGAYLEFNNGELVKDSENPSLPPAIATTFILTTNNAAFKFMNAQPNSGRGSWITRWYPLVGVETNDSVTLTVIGGTMRAEAYTSTLTWTLTDAP